MLYRNIVYALMAIGILLPVNLAAQQNNVWIFGDHAGIDFGSGTPIPFYNSEIDMLEGTAVASDVNGDVLFYTDGMSVWDRNDELMPNGTELGGNSSSTSTLILQKPGDCTKYYIFCTQDHNDGGDLYYSVVDMCLNNGYGKVIASQKKVLLQTSVSEKLCVVPNSNGIDEWLITHELSNNKYKVYAITTSGINTVPASYSLGSSFSYNSQAGYLKANSAGSKLATGVFWTNICEVVNFNSTTGAVYGPATNYGPELTASSNGLYYGLEFSPNGNFLYATRSGFGGIDAELYQINLASGIHTLLDTEDPPLDYYYGALRLAPNGKIYMARNGKNYLGVINNPDVTGVGCNFMEEGLLLSANSYSQLGLPLSMITTAFDPASVLSLGNDTTTCESFVINLDATCDMTFLWQDGDTSSSYTISNSGTYWVTASNQCGIATDTLHVLSGIGGTITGNSGICIGDSTTLAAPAADDYLWSTGETDQSITVAPGETTSYWVALTLGGCVDTLSILVDVFPNPKSSFSFSEDTLCIDQPPFILTGGVPSGGTYEGDGVINNYFFPLTAGTGLHTINYVYTNTFGCSAVSSIELFVDVCTALESSINTEGISVSPTLVSSYIELTSNGQYPGDYEIVLMDVYGRTITSIQTTFKVGSKYILSVNDLPAGMYYVLAKGKENSFTRIIKQ